MASAPTTPTASSFNWASIIPLLELAGNTTLTVLGTTGTVPGGQAIASLAAALESSLNPLISSLSSGATATADVMAGYGALIGVLNTLQKQPGLPASTLAKISEYIAAAQDATSAYLAAASGYSATVLTPVTPIVEPAAAPTATAAPTAAPAVAYVPVSRG